MRIAALKEKLASQFADSIDNYIEANGELTIELPAEHLHAVCLTLRDKKDFAFDQLIDVCGVDYQDYGLSEWQTESTTTTGYGRAVDKLPEFERSAKHKARFAAVYHLLSLTHNHRLRLRCFLPEDNLNIASVNDIWAAANWFEREAFDLFGLVFEGHPDLRRILTDYGFMGHPFRKDFPLIGNVEMRYDAGLKKCVYEPVSIQPRVLVPKVIRQQTQAMETAGSPVVQNPPVEEKKPS